MNSENKRLPIITTFAAFLCFIGTACYKLMEANLWLDETIEYWYSKSLVGALSNHADIASFTATTSMYERILETQQPPLYNVLMHFWLRICDTEIWFRLSGVVIGFLFALGLYQCVKYLTNTYLASAAVFFAAFNYQLVYYWQECAEYGLMLMWLVFAIYYFLLALDSYSLRRGGAFMLFSVLAVYSQYGAAFPVAAMALCLLLKRILDRKEGGRQDLIGLLITYAVGLLGGALPLYEFFLKKQMEIQASYTSSGAMQVTFEKNPVYDFIYQTYQCFKWCFFSSFDIDLVAKIAFVAFLLLLITLCIFSKSSTFRFVAGANFLCFVLYYIASKMGLYAIGKFGFRYNIFLIPMWTVLLFLMGREAWRLGFSENRRILDRLLLVVVTILLAAYAAASFLTGLYPHWDKSTDMKNLVAAWYEEGADQYDTVVYYLCDAEFSYYVDHNESADGDEYEHICYLPLMYGASTWDFMDYITSYYGGTLPDTLYVISNSTLNEYYDYLEAFNQFGYSAFYEFNAKCGERILGFTK